MRTAPKPKSGKNSSKKKFSVDSREPGLTEIAGADNRASTSISEEILAAGPSIKGISSEEKFQLIAEAAYFRSEKRSFTPGYELEDWLAAETEVETKLSDIGTSMESQSHVDRRPRRR
ncbi:MAG TPA: DUF2934 domain-containing protein [Acidobacteriota bacterium]|nr:DUF2934 domain-containing protein [Acidobacteriota bacterium]